MTIERLKRDIAYLKENEEEWVAMASGNSENPEYDNRIAQVYYMARIRAERELAELNSLDCWELTAKCEYKIYNFGYHGSFVVSNGNPRKN